MELGNAREEDSFWKARDYALQALLCKTFDENLDVLPQSLFEEEGPGSSEFSQRIAAYAQVVGRERQTLQYQIKLLKETEAQLLFELLHQIQSC